MSSIIDRISAQIATALEGKLDQSQKDAVRQMSLEMDKLHPTPEIGPYTDHPGYAAHILQCKTNFITYVKTQKANDKIKIVGFGDSVLAQAKPRISFAIPLNLNDALGGMRAHHMLQCINDMVVQFNIHQFVPKYIVIGTLGGNDLLIHQEVHSVISQSIIVLNRIRELWPQARIIIYGLPMTISDYLIQNFGAFDMAIMDWMVKDVNSVMIPLIKNFVANKHVLPKADMSCDGVHLSAIGQVLLGDLILNGMTGKPKRLINNA